MCAKYLKMIISDLLLVIVLLFLLSIQRFSLPGAIQICVIWAFVNPIMVLAFNNWFILRSEVSYLSVITQFKLFAQVFGIFAFLSAGMIAYSQGNHLDFVFFMYGYFPPFILFEAIEWGFLY